MTSKSFENDIVATANNIIPDDIPPIIIESGGDSVNNLVTPVIDRAEEYEIKKENRIEVEKCEEVLPIVSIEETEKIVSSRAALVNLLGLKCDKNEAVEIGEPVRASQTLPAPEKIILNKPRHLSERLGLKREDCNNNENKNVENSIMKLDFKSNNLDEMEKEKIQANTGLTESKSKKPHFLLSNSSEHRKNFQQKNPNDFAYNNTLLTGTGKRFNKNPAIYLEELLFELNCLDAAHAGESVPFITIHLRRLLAREISRVNSLLSSSVVGNGNGSKKENLFTDMFTFNHGQRFGSSNSASPDLRHHFLREEVLEASNIGMKLPNLQQHSLNYQSRSNASAFVNSGIVTGPDDDLQLFSPKDFEGSRMTKMSPLFGPRLLTKRNNLAAEGNNSSSRRKSSGTAADYFVDGCVNFLTSSQLGDMSSPIPLNVGTLKCNTTTGLDSSKLCLVSLSHKIYIPEHPTYNFIGRILGPRGNSVRRLEALTGCQILIRGKGSVKEPNRETKLLNTTGWEHLKEALHVQIVAEEINEDLCRAKLRHGCATLQRLLTPQFDNYKRQQLVQLAIINGTYRS